METEDAVAALAALAQETRLSIFRLLVQAGPEGLAAGGIGESLQVPAATLSFHLKELARADLVSARQDGRFSFYTANYPQMAALMSFLTRNCCHGMPAEGLMAMESALDRCCVPSTQRKSNRSK